MTTTARVAWVAGTPVAVSADDRWHYWVAYTHTGPAGGGMGNGAMEIQTSEPLTDPDALYTVKVWIGDSQTLLGVVISNWQIMQVPASAIPSAGGL